VEAKPDKDAKKEEKDEGKKEDDEEEEGGRRGRGSEEKPTVTPGLNRFLWDLRTEKAGTFEGLILWSGDPIQPVVVPGDYQVRFTAGPTHRRPLLSGCSPIPRAKATPEDLAARAASSSRCATSSTRPTMPSAASARCGRRSTRCASRLAGDDKTAPVRDAGKALNEKMTAVEEALYQTRTGASRIRSTTPYASMTS